MTCPWQARPVRGSTIRSGLSGSDERTIEDSGGAIGFIGVHWCAVRACVAKQGTVTEDTSPHATPEHEAPSTDHRLAPNFVRWPQRLSDSTVVSGALRTGMQHSCEVSYGMVILIVYITDPLIVQPAEPSY